MGAKRRDAALPKSVWSAMGPIRVTVVAKLASPTEELYGHWNPFTREIHVRDGMHPAAQRQALFHEWLHAVLHDAGTVIDAAVEESVVDAIATAMTAESFSRT